MPGDRDTPDEAGIRRYRVEALDGVDVQELDGDSCYFYDFTALDTLMPHPVYGSLRWVCVLNPGPNSFETVQRLLTEAHALAAGRYERTHHGDQTGEES